MAKLAGLSERLPEGSCETRTLQPAETRSGTFQRKRPLFGAAAATSCQVLPRSVVNSTFTVPPAAGVADSQVMACLLSALHVSPPFGEVSRGGAACSAWPTRAAHAATRARSRADRRLLWRFMGIPCPLLPDSWPLRFFQLEDPNGIAAINLVLDLLGQFQRIEQLELRDLLVGHEHVGAEQEAVGPPQDELPAEFPVAGNGGVAARLGQVAVQVRVLRQEPLQGPAGDHRGRDLGVPPEVRVRGVGGDGRPEAGRVADEGQLREGLQGVLQARQAGRIN